MPIRVKPIAAVAALALAAGSTPASATPAAGPLPTAVKASCPTLAAGALGPSALAGATSAALSQAQALYPGLDRTGMRATEAVLAPFDADRGGYARKCGGDLLSRTVVVYLEFPAMRPSSSLSQGVVLLSRFAGHFRVWAVLH